MKLKLTLQRTNGPESDVVVTTDATASVGDVAATLAERDPFRSKLGMASPSAPTVAIVDTASGRRRTLDRDVAISEAELGSGATVVLASQGEPEPRARAAAAVTLRVIEGPDAGAAFALQNGSHVLGRDAGTDVTLSDPLVSKRHARVDVSAQSVRLVDLNSANGLEVDGGLVTRIELEDGSTVRVGDTLLQAVIAPSAETVDADFSAPVAFNRSPRVEQRYPGQEFIAPSPPTEQESQPFPWVILIAPVLIGGIMVLVLPGRGLQMLIFAAAAPLLMIGTWLTTRAQRKRKHKLDVERFEARAAQLEAEMIAEVPREREIRRQESPTTSEVVEQSLQLGPLLWTRRPEHWQFLSVNLGIGTMASRNTVRISHEDTGIPEYLDRVKRTRAEFRDVSDVPVTENLYFSGALGIAGEHRLAADCARGLLVQLAGLHSPAELVIGAIVGTAWTPEFEWLKWLPHTGSPHSPIEAVHLANSQATGGALLSAIEDLIVARKLSPEVRGAVMEERSALVAGASAGDGAEVATPPPAATPAVVLLIAEDAPVDRARLVQVAERAADAGIYPIWVASELASVPAVARTFITPTSDDSATVGLVRLGSELVDVRTHRVSRDDALRFARRLAPVVDAGALIEDASDLPRSTMLLSLIGPELATSPAVAVGRWRENDSIHDRSGGAPARRRAGKLRAIVGSAGLDAMHLDLRTQGPHALVGGTTGSGKSEFLQAWVLGMAAEYSPDRVTFLFVDYKGGSAFADCVNLPHCVGLVTDLSPHLVRRALTSLRAELHHREHLFNRKKAKDLLELEKRGDPEAPPALVIVIDEFAALASEVPEFVDGVVDVAQRGRSLGIHLIMATQRPAGVIKDNLRANTNLRIALRMADESDSMDVVGDKVAGTFDPSIPGRGIAKTGPGRLTPFQSAYAGGWTSDTPAPPSVEVAELRFGTEQAWERPGADTAPTVEASEQGPTDQARLVANLIAAAKSVPLPAPRRPWLDELATAYDLTKLRQRTDTEIVLGVSDLPQRQRQDEIYFRPDTDGNIVIYGAGGTGKTVTLRSIAAAAGITPRGGPVDVYGLDFGTGGLKMLEALPHVGSIVSGDDPERVVRLLRKLKGVLDDRSNRYAESDAGTIVDYRRIASAPDERRIVLLVDNFPSFRNEFEVGAARAPWYAAFQQLLVEGRGLGIHVAMTADRPGSVPTGIASAFQRRVVHRLADEGGYMMVDAPADILSAASPPGRAIVDGVETQIAIVGGMPSTADQAKALTVLGQAIERAGRTPAEAIGSLAVQYPATDLPASINGSPVLGISEDTLAPIAVEASGAFLLAGAPASGRSNALEWFVQSIDAAIPTATRYYIGSARSSIGALPGWEATAVSVDEAAALAKDITAVVTDAETSGKVVVIIEQLADFLSSAADGPMVEMIKAIKRTDHFVLAESETGGWGSSWPLLSEVKSARTGFLLQPESIEGDTILKTSLPRVSRSEFPPGRGYLIARGKAVRVQLPWLGE